jgi:ribosomal RNA-processing protein 12
MKMYSMSAQRTLTIPSAIAAREVNKSVVGFVRVAVAAMSSNRLEPLLPLVVDGIMKYNGGKDRFRQKIKIILKKLVRLYGYDAIAPLVPNKDARLITHMRKLAERSARRKARGLEDGKTMAGDDFDNMMESDEDDSDDGRTFMTGGTGFTKLTSMTGKTTKRSFMDRSVNSKGARSSMTAKSAASKAPQIAAELKGEVLDLLDSSKMARSVRFADMNMKDGDFSDDEDDGGDEINFDNQGRIVISEGPPQLGGARANADDDSDDVEENLELKAGGKRRRVSKFESVKLNAAKSKKAKNNKQQQVQSLGAAYKNKKAGGDAIKKNQKYEPYAFVPLNAKDYTKKNRGKAVSKMGTVVHNNKRKRN